MNVLIDLQLVFTVLKLSYTLKFSLSETKNGWRVRWNAANCNKMIYDIASKRHCQLNFTEN